MNRAVNECIREGILKEFLLKNKAEAIQMSIFEYDEEREKKLLKKAYLKEGEVPDSLREQVCVQQDSKTLMAWLKLALKADTVEEFRQGINKQTV